MEYLYVPALVLYCFCLLSVELVSPSVSVIIHPVADVEKSPHNDLVLHFLEFPDQDPDALNYASLSFTSKKEKKKMLKRREAELDPNVVYATTR
ncbi:hypothetical protein DPEC_G00103970 [Dallia pectoralis]|uniref:Uncharacterized protein n=1 Tax=Dallia pectoralis TaxID=75939 RepID=A0ACC2GXW6_DALPE|nr:hypothetical protein DPEC_G00103970 [Dallia pectoralis]